MGSQETPAKPGRELPGGWKCCLDRAGPTSCMHTHNCLGVCMFVLCNANKNVRSQELNGNLILCFFLSFDFLHLFRQMPGKGRQERYGGDNKNDRPWEKKSSVVHLWAFLTLHFTLFQLLLCYLWANAFIIASHFALSNTSTPDNDPLLGPSETADLWAGR